MLEFTWTTNVHMEVTLNGVSVGYIERYSSPGGSQHMWFLFNDASRHYLFPQPIAQGNLNHVKQIAQNRFGRTTN